MNKLDLRKSFLEKRLRLSSTELGIRSEKVASKVHETPEIYALAVYHIFLPIKAKNEISTWPIIHFLWQQKKKVVVPATRSGNLYMESYSLTPETKLLENQWGIPEPVSAQAMAPEEIQVVFLPLVAFDLSGHRVGYGKGFYDRFLQQLNSQVLKVGLSMFPAVDKIDDVGAWDVKMDWCITPEQAINF